MGFNLNTLAMVNFEDRRDIEKVFIFGFFLNFGSCFIHFWISQSLAMLNFVDRRNIEKVLVFRFFLNLVFVRLQMLGLVLLHSFFYWESFWCFLQHIFMHVMCRFFINWFQTDHVDALRS